MHPRTFALFIAFLVFLLILDSFSVEASPRKRRRKKKKEDEDITTQIAQLQEDIARETRMDAVLRAEMEREEVRLAQQRSSAAQNNATQQRSRMKKRLRDGGMALEFYPNSLDRAVPYVDESSDIGHAGVYFAKQKLVQVISQYQKIQVWDTRYFGRMLVLDDDIQITESDEEHYHEMFVHVPLAYFPNATRVLIIGGGDGGIARQCLRYKRIESVTMVDIDEQVVSVVKEHFTTLAPVFDDPRVDVVIDNGVKWTADAVESGKVFDVIFIDSTDYTDPIHRVEESITSPAFYASLRKILKPGGVVVGSPHTIDREFTLVANSESIPWNLQHVRVIQRNLVDGGFTVQCPYRFNGGEYVFFWASTGAHPANMQPTWDGISDQLSRLKYYTPDVHLASFAMPNYFREAIPSCDGVAWRTPASIGEGLKDLKEEL